eukprot:CAMPEP_0202743162 /NCGR_PEP_ID=MMETSP1388-20130828/5595_1 /ASSEMBLY_ACC=CAM_ASM_000864 /TAXON_ID=37098 /ORGANISM="Isochrysis sp, Strain CCMP1244" /LENGTH=58 /DNA_ID=CAMNT_0049410159 /DNA_START=259 /DNA_END=435 /DNA_ORIENTATION=-
MAMALAARPQLRNKGFPWSGAGSTWPRKAREARWKRSERERSAGGGPCEVLFLKGLPP